MEGMNRLLLYYAHVRPCTPMYAQYAHKLHPVRPVRPWAYMGVHCTPIKNLYAHIIVRPWAYMGVHVRPQKNPNNFLWAYNVRPCTPMYAHGRTFVWAYKFSMGVQCTPMYAHKKNVSAHKRFTNKQNLVKVQAKWLKVVSRILN